jgi:adenosylcobinamide-phosphate synthase
MNTAAAMLVALGLDALFGWPRWLYQWFGHPVTWIGQLIDMLDKRLNLPERSAVWRRGAGVAAALIVVMATAVVASGFALLVPEGALGVLLTGIVAWPLIAARSLYEHVAAVVGPLNRGDLAAARGAVSQIVGRDPSKLEAGGIGRAAIESLAENTSDGVVAPMFWGVCFGLPGIAAYKALNTLDSMIAHRTPRHAAFGWASARMDDFANLLPARLTALLFAVAAGRAGTAALRTAWTDASHHRSPNAGWPEAAMAGALGVRLSGPRAYGDQVADEPWVNAGAPDPASGDILRALALYRRSILLFAIMLAGLAAI